MQNLQNFFHHIQHLHLNLRTIFISILFGHNAAKAGLLIFSIIFILNFEITKSAPVLPAEIITFDFFL